MRIRRKTREAYVRDRQQVVLQVCQPTAAQVQADIAANQAKAKRLAIAARKREEECECKPGRRPLPECHVHGNR